MRGDPPRPLPKLDVPLFLRESDFDEKFLLLTSLMTKKSSFFDTLKKGLKMAVFGGLGKGVKNRHFLVFFGSCWVLLNLLCMNEKIFVLYDVEKFFSVCGDVTFSSRCRFFVIFQPFFDPSKRPPKWPKNGLRAGHSVSIKMIMTNILVRSTSSSTYVHLDNFVKLLYTHIICSTQAYVEWEYACVKSSSNEVRGVVLCQLSYRSYTDQ
jgi:hypothetical protein